jgi:penicillin V acylase-like amidase (Ntn superfamily)
MRSLRALRRSSIGFVAATLPDSGPVLAAACTRARYVAKDGTVITGLSMDWVEDLKSNMWVLPRGMKRDGLGGKHGVSWGTGSGSLIASSYDAGTSERMNGSGLVVTMLALAGSDYATPAEVANVLSMGTWAQHIFAKHASVAEAVADLRKERFGAQTLVLPRPARQYAPVNLRRQRRLGRL